MIDKIVEATFSDLKRKQRSITKLFPPFYKRVAAVAEKGGVRFVGQDEEGWHFSVHSGTKDDVWYDFDLKFKDVEKALQDATRYGDVWKRNKQEFDYRKLARKFFNVADIQIECSCLTGDTKVPLLDGRILTLDEINSEFGKDKPFYVIASDENGDPVPAKAHFLGETKKVKKYIKVILDNGESVKCTAGHLFRMLDGSYRRADELKEDHSLLPIYSLFDENPNFSSEYFKQTQLNNIQKKLGSVGVSVKRVIKNTSLEEIPVYDLFVEKYHNFALGSGIYVHNCPAFLYWGSAYILSQGKYDAKVPPPEGRSPDIRNPKRFGAVCKHGQAVFKVLPFYYSTLAKWLKTYHKDLVNKYEKFRGRYTGTLSKVGENVSEDAPPPIPDEELETEEPKEKKPKPIKYSEEPISVQPSLRKRGKKELD